MEIARLVEVRGAAASMLSPPSPLSPFRTAGRWWDDDGRIYSTFTRTHVQTRRTVQRAEAGAMAVVAAVALGTLMQSGEAGCLKSQPGPQYVYVYVCM